MINRKAQETMQWLPLLITFNFNVKFFSKAEVKLWAIIYPNSK